MSSETGQRIPEEYTKMSAALPDLQLDTQKEDSHDADAEKAEQDIKGKLAEQEARANTLELMDASGHTVSRLDIGAVSELSPEQKTAVEATIKNPEFSKLTAAADIVEKLFTKGLIEPAQAGAALSGLLKTRTDRFIPRTLLNEVAKKDQKFAQDMAEVANKTGKEWEGTIANPNSNPDAVLTGIAKTFKFKDLAERTAYKPFTGKKELVAAMGPAQKKLLESPDAPVYQLKLLKNQYDRDAFEVGAVPAAKIPEMFRNVTALIQEKPEFASYVEDLKAAVVNLVKMGKLEMGAATEAMAGLNKIK